MTEKQYNLRAGYYHNYTGICSDTDENLTTNGGVDLLNKQEETIQNQKKIYLTIKTEIGRTWNTIRTKRLR